MTAPRLGNRKLKLALGYLLGCVLGVLLALPFALWLKVAEARQGVPRDSTERVLAAGLGVASLLGGTLGVGLTYVLTTFPAGRRWIAVYAVLGACVGSLVGGLIGLVCYLDFARHPIPFSRQIQLPLIFRVVFTLLGAVLGFVAGTGAAEDREKHERDAMLRKLDAPGAEREPRCGSLDDARRAAVQASDPDHLTDARRVEDLGV